jgi:CBS domain-containing protein
MSFDPSTMTVTALGSNFWAQVAIANVVLLLFNLIPAFPMDGGRVLRAALASWLGFGRATKVAARIGQALAIVFAILGFMGNPLLVLIAAFIFMAAAGEAGYVRVREMTRGREVSDAMLTAFESLGVMSTVDDAAAMLVHTAQQEFPILDGASRLRGIVRRDTIIEAQQSGKGAASVLEIMDKDIPVVPQDSSLEAAVTVLRRSRARAVGVVDAAGRLVGYLTPQNLADLVRLGTSRGREAPAWQRG